LNPGEASLKFFSLKFSNLQLSLELLRDGHLDLGLLVLLGVAAQEEFEKGTF